MCKLKNMLIDSSLYGLPILLSIRRRLSIPMPKSRKNPEIPGNLQVFSYIALKTASFFGMLGIPPEASVDRLAAAAAKLPM